MLHWSLHQNPQVLYLLLRLLLEIGHSKRYNPHGAYGRELQDLVCEQPARLAQRIFLVRQHLVSQQPLGGLRHHSDLSGQCLSVLADAYSTRKPVCFGAPYSAIGFHRLNFFLDGNCVYEHLRIFEY